MLANDAPMALDSNHLGGLLNKVSIGHHHPHPNWSDRPSPAPLQLGSTSHDPFAYQTHHQPNSLQSSAHSSYSHPDQAGMGGRSFPPPLEPRQYTILKEVGDGSFGTVWLADWHSPLQLPTGTTAPGPSSRPEYKGKRLVAIKRMKKAFEGGWGEAMKLKELKVRRLAIGPVEVVADSNLGFCLAVAPTNPYAPQHYPTLRRLPNAFEQGVILCVRMHGG